MAGTEASTKSTIAPTAALPRLMRPSTWMPMAISTYDQMTNGSMRESRPRLSGDASAGRKRAADRLAP